jgi:arylsulfatase A-like enzyme
MTGRWQQRVGLETALLPADKNKGLRPSEPTVSSLLKANGYKTSWIGKWHLGMEPEFSPTRHGFDEFFGIRSGNVDMYSHRYRTGFIDLWENDTTVEREGYLTDLFAERAVDTIRRFRADPFFLYVAFNAPHWPFQPPGRPQDVRTLATWYEGTRSEYAQMVQGMDAAVGRVLGALDDHGLARDTLVIFTNDNGGERLSDNGQFFHGKHTLWEGGLRVPAILRWPARLSGGKTSSASAITMDFTASILAATNTAPVPSRPLDGIDLLPVLRGERAPAERTLFWRTNQQGRQQKAARRGRWKYVQDAGIDMLFDLTRDLGERHNLAFQQQALVAELRSAVDAWEKQVGHS